jgi:DNA (cytosine-5)-methyltransferase 1
LFRFDKCIQYDEVNTSQRGINALSNIDKSDVNGDASNSDCIRCDNRGDNWEERYICRDEGFAEENKSEWNRRERGSGQISSNAANPNSDRLERSVSTKFNKQLSSEKKYDEKHLSIFKSGIQFKNFPTVSPICTRDDGLSDRLDGITFSKWRNESIKAGGNAIVPQVVHQIFKAIEQYETTRQA